MRVSLAGAASSQMVTEEREAWLSMVGNHALRVWLEARTPVLVESPLGYHSCSIEVLTIDCESSLGTLSGGQFDWGGRLPKSNGGVQRFPQRGWKSRNRVQRQKGA